MASLGLATLASGVRVVQKHHPATSLPFPSTWPPKKNPHPKMRSIIIFGANAPTNFDGLCRLHSLSHCYNSLHSWKGGQIFPRVVQSPQQDKITISNNRKSDVASRRQCEAPFGATLALSLHEAYCGPLAPL